MRREARRCNLRARRFAATDGRHRVVRRSQCEPYTRDLTSFALRWDEARPAIGVALTADQERHYVGYVGSWLSHMRALRQGLEEGSPFVVVLEDDQVLSSDFNGVLQDIVESAGDLLDVIILGPLDWRLRSLQYAQRRKVMQLRHPCSGTRSKEEEFMAELYGYTPTLQQESLHPPLWELFLNFCSYKTQEDIKDRIVNKVLRGVEEHLLPLLHWLPGNDWGRPALHRLLWCLARV